MDRQTVTTGVNFSLSLSLSSFRPWESCLFSSITAFCGFELLITAPFKICKPGILLINERALEPFTPEVTGSSLLL